MEFRTRAPGDHGESGGGNDVIEKHLKKVWSNVQNDPKLKMELAKAIQESDVSPSLLRAIYPDMGESIDQLEKQKAQATDDDQNPDQNPENMTDDLNAEKVVSLIDEVIDLSDKGGDMTLTELKDFCQKNPDIVQMAIGMRME